MDRGAGWATVHGVTEPDTTWGLNNAELSPRVWSGLGWASLCSASQPPGGSDKGPDLSGGQPLTPGKGGGDADPGQRRDPSVNLRIHPLLFTTWPGAFSVPCKVALLLDYPDGASLTTSESEPAKAPLPPVFTHVWVRVTVGC